MLNEQGYRVKGKLLKGKSFDKWLTNQKYTGTFTFGGRECSNIYPPIIDKETFDAVQERLAKNRYTLGGKETARVPYLLTGNVVCANGHTKSKLELKQSNQCKAKVENRFESRLFCRIYLYRKQNGDFGFLHI